MNLSPESLNQDFITIPKAKVVKVLEQAIQWKENTGDPDSTSELFMGYQLVIGSTSGGYYAIIYRMNRSDEGNSVMVKLVSKEQLEWDGLEWWMMETLANCILDDPALWVDPEADFKLQDS